MKLSPTTLSEGIPGFVGGMNRRRVLELAIRKYHKRDETAESALRYLRATYEKNFGADSRLRDTEDQFIEYVQIHQSQGVLTIYAFHRVAIPIGADVTLTGEVPRIDYAREDGYAVWLFQYGRRPWRDELRMPLLQAHVARKFSVDAHLITVGVYDLIHSTYEDTVYSSEELLVAEAELGNLAMTIQDALDRT